MNKVKSFSCIMKKWMYFVFFYFWFLSVACCFSLHWFALLLTMHEKGDNMPNQIYVDVLLKEE